MSEFKRIAVFCGSSPGSLPDFGLAARQLGALLAREGIDLIYGGGNMGVMGELARAAMQAGGKAIGVIPERLNSLVAHTELTELVVVPGMHERKQAMYGMADAYLILPGGIGTMEEFFEVFTWQQLGYHSKPIGILNTQAFFDPLFAVLDKLVETGFFKTVHRDTLVVSTDPAELLAKLRQSQPCYSPKLPERR